jgi:lipoprotein
MDKLKDDVMQQSKPGKNHLNTNYSGLPLTCSCRDADLCIIILNKEIMDAIKETSASKKNIKNQETRSHTDGFRRNNANYWNKREICRFYLYSSIIWFCPVLEELGK